MDLMSAMYRSEKVRMIYPIKTGIKRLGISSETIVDTIKAAVTPMLDTPTAPMTEANEVFDLKILAIA